MIHDEDIRDRLSTVEIPPGRVTPDSAVRSGRRRVARRRWTAAGGVVVAVTAVLVGVPVLSDRGKPARPVAPLPSPSTCRASVLPGPMGSFNDEATAVDPTGRYVVGAGGLDHRLRAMMWTDGKPALLPAIGQRIDLSDVNAHGVAVGRVENTAYPGGEAVVRYANGSFSRLKRAPGTIYDLPRIDTAGDVLATVQAAGKTVKFVLWKAGSTTPITLPLPAAATAGGFTDDGTIVGTLRERSKDPIAYAWDWNGHGRELAGPERSEVTGVFGDWAAGTVGRDKKTVVWNLKTGSMIRPDEGTADASGWAIIGGDVFAAGHRVHVQAPSGQWPAVRDISRTGLAVGSTIPVRGGYGNAFTWRC